MTDAPRDIRDILAECMRRETRGLVRPLWSDWQSFADDECEQVRIRADHLIRLLAELGIELVRTGEPKPTTRPDGPVLYRYGLVGQKSERVIRWAGDDRWEIVTVAAGVETVEQAFTLTDASLNGGLVLTDDPAAKTIHGLGRRLAAALEIHRLCAAGIGASNDR